MSKRAVIEVFTCAGDRANEYMPVLQNSMQKFASGKYEIKYKCIINTKQFREVPGWEVVEIDEDNSSSPHPKAAGSYNHGRQLNKIHKYVTGELLVIADADTCVMQKDWDSIMAKHIVDKTVAYGVNSSKNNKRFLGSPCIIFCMFNSKIFCNMKTNFLPMFKEKANKNFKLCQKSYYLDPQLANLYRIGRLQKIFCDTGWALATDLQQIGYNGGIIEHEDNLRLDPLHAEFETWYYEKAPFIAHAGGSRSHQKDVEQWKSFARSRGLI